MVPVPVVIRAEQAQEVEAPRPQAPAPLEQGGGAQVLGGGGEPDRPAQGAERFVLRGSRWVPAPGTSAQPGAQGPPRADRQVPALMQQRPDPEQQRRPLGQLQQAARGEGQPGAAQFFHGPGLRAGGGSAKRPHEGPEVLAEKGKQPRDDDTSAEARERAARAEHCKELAETRWAEWKRVEGGEGGFVDKKDKIAANNCAQALRIIPTLAFAELARLAGFDDNVARAGVLPVETLVALALAELTLPSPGQLQKAFTAVQRFEKYLCDKKMAKKEVLQSTSPPTSSTSRPSRGRRP